MFVLFRVSDPKVAGSPPQDLIVNVRQVESVDPIFSGQKDGEGNPILAPEGSMITLVSKRKFAVPQKPREVLRAFQTGKVEGT